MVPRGLRNIGPCCLLGQVIVNIHRVSTPSVTHGEALLNLPMLEQFNLIRLLRSV